MKTGEENMNVNEYKLRRLMDHVLPVMTCGTCPAMDTCEYTDEESYEYRCVDLIIKAISEESK